ncbi:MAG: hypothetical protein COV67_13770, partial [Nitrospinae bacterium CG11_big_fil_rev_8_21_14_0_20_56_8]
MPQELRSVSFIVPCLNEEANLPPFVECVEEIRKSDPATEYHIIFVNDGSTDNTLEVVRRLSRERPHVYYVSLTRNFGSHLALQAGVDICQTDAAVFVAVDLQNDPRLVFEMLGYAREGAEIVIGRRREKKAGWLTRALASGFYFLFNLVGDVKLPPGGTDFVLIGRMAIEFLQKNREHHVNIFMLLLWPGFTSKTFEYAGQKRRMGRSKWTLIKRVRLAMDSFFGFSTGPLRLITLIGSLLASGSFLYMLYIVIETLILGTPVPGFPTLVTIVS